MISLAIVLLLLNVLLLLFLAQGAQLPPPMEVKPPAPQSWWDSPPFSVSWNGRRFPQEHDVWPWWRPGT